MSTSERKACRRCRRKWARPGKSRCDECGGWDAADQKLRDARKRKINRLNPDVPIPYRPTDKAVQLN